MMSAEPKIADVLRDQTVRIMDVQCLLTAVSKINPGAADSRLAVMAEKQLDDIRTALEDIGDRLLDIATAAKQ